MRERFVSFGVDRGFADRAVVGEEGRAESARLDPRSQQEVRCEYWMMLVSVCCVPYLCKPGEFALLDGESLLHLTRMPRPARQTFRGVFTCIVLRRIRPSAPSPQ